MTTKIPKYGQSSTKAEAKAFITEFSTAIRETPQPLRRITKRVDWNLSGRGQGKRSGGMTKGGMCGLMGSEQYDGVDVSEYTELLKEPNYKTMSYPCVYRYAHARSVGCNHLEAMMFAILNV